MPRLAAWQKRKIREGAAAKNRHPSPPRAQPTVANQWQTCLESDLLRLKRITSHSKRDELKRTELIPRYIEYLNGVMEAGQGGQNDVLVRVMIWCIDAGEFNRAIDLAAYAIQHDMSSPEGFQRDIKNILAGDIARKCIDLLKLGRAVSAFERPVNKIYKLSADWDLVDKIRAQLERLQAEIKAATKPGEALEHAERAWLLDQAVGVIPLKKRLQKQISAVPLPGADNQAGDNKTGST